MSFSRLSHCDLLWNEGASLVTQMVKNLPAMLEIWVRSLGWENPLEKGMATHSSILAWRIHYEILWDMRYYLTLVRMNIIKKFKINAGEGREKKGTLLHCWWEYKLV